MLKEQKTRGDLTMKIYQKVKNDASIWKKEKKVKGHLTTYNDAMAVR